jgi:UDP-N-acetyl-D-glucosamine dehydrogenase
MKFQPGPGLGGHCIPVDPTYLSWKMKSLNFPFFNDTATTEIYTQMPEYVAEKVGDLLNEDRITVNGARVLVLGVAYKSNVSDMRESPALDVMRLLAAKGAEIRYSDPHVPEITFDGGRLKSVDLTDEALASADVVVIVTEHDAVDYDRVAAKARRIYDTRNATRNVTANREKVRKL